MSSTDDQAAILVTGACGHIGGELCRTLGDAGRRILPLDVDQCKIPDALICDLRSKSDLAHVFQLHPIRIVIHLAGVLPSAFRVDPLLGADVNLAGSCELMRHSAAAHVKRVIFASSMSVYGSSATDRGLTEDDPAAPDEPYGASKRAVELIGETLAKQGAFEFVALRIARVVGPGIKKTASRWRSQIFDSCPPLDSVSIPFMPDAALSLVHIDEVTRMICVLAEVAEIRRFIYNTPAETWRVRQLKEAVERLRGISITLGPERDHSGPICDGSRFALDFSFRLKSIRDYLSSGRRAHTW